MHVLACLVTYVVERRLCLVGQSTAYPFRVVMGIVVHAKIGRLFFSRGSGICDAPRATVPAVFSFSAKNCCDGKTTRGS